MPAIVYDVAFIIFRLLPIIYAQFTIFYVRHMTPMLLDETFFMPELSHYVFITPTRYATLTLITPLILPLVSHANII